MDGGNLMSCWLSAGPHYFIKGASRHWNRSRLGAPFPFRCRNGSNPATCLTAVRRTSRPWSTSYDTALPMLRSRSVTGWPHHLIPQISCAPAVQRDLQNHSRPGRHRGNLRCSPRGCGSTRKAPALQAVSCGSVTRHLQCCARQLLRRAVIFIGSCPG